ncbi:BCCT transporter [Ferrimonas lipolytica]|uniref:BCCT transporter n=2 Tax=Ferrimonas lipolytica TaxID=2724191 RepID=A0A6H1UIJ8_9GAMM|nr:BCCT transporter [Ferrimonas lipolytica]
MDLIQSITITTAATQPAYRSKSFFVITSLIALVIFFPRYSINVIADYTQSFIEQFGLALLLFSTVMVLLTLAISVSPLGKLRLGGAQAKTEFSTLSWLAMLFTAGMGSGLIFWGIAEPLFHFANPPAFVDAGNNSKDTALAITYFHWGIHAWSIYAMAGLAVAWFSFNRGRSMHISSSFSAKSNQSRYRFVDWMAIIAILFGVAGTFANTIALVQTGLQQTVSAEIGSVLFRYGLILLIALLFTGSSILGLHRGIKRLSLFNTMLMLVLVSVVFVSFSPLETLNTIVSSTTSYLSLLPEVSFSINDESRQWSLGWTIIYLVWWVAWAPFVGPFIARISKGRSIRQFLLSAVWVPTIASIVWFSAFGGSALEQPFAQQVIDAVNQDYTQGLFRFFQQISFGEVLSIAAIVLLITFIITSADSALLVCCMLGGDEGNKSKIVWAALLVSLSMALIYINDVDLNKQVAIAGALPFTLVMIGQVISMAVDMVRYQRQQ